MDGQGESGFAAGPEESGERVIGRLWERNYDSGTSALLESLPFREDWDCLDLGAGTGSMARWMAGRARRGSVLAVDVDTSLMDDDVPHNLTVKQMDLRAEDFVEGSFDLILARAVFSQLPDPDASLARAARWLAPGGWLLVEDFCFMPSEHSTTETGKAVIDAYVRTFEAHGVDAYWGRRAPALMARAGLVEMGKQVRPLGPGQGETENDLMRARLAYQGAPLVDNGLVSAQQLAEFVASLDDPGAQDIATLQISVWARRPAA